MTKFYKLKKQWLGGEVTLKEDTKVWFVQDMGQWYMCFHEGRIKIVKYVIDEDMLPLYFEEIKEEQPFQWDEALVWDVIREHEKSHTKNIQHTIDQFKKSKQQTNTIPSGEKYKQWDIPMNATITHNQSQPKTETIDESHYKKYTEKELIDGEEKIISSAIDIIRQECDGTYSDFASGWNFVNPSKSPMVIVDKLKQLLKKHQQ